MTENEEYVPLSRPPVASAGRAQYRRNTLVILMGEFGRTPQGNPRCGRDHFTRGFNAVLAGDGVARGAIVGKTDNGGG